MSLSSISPEPQAGPAFPYDTIVVLPWNDPVVDPLGFDPRSVYVEQFWLGILGPSSVWMLRRVAAGFDVWPDGFELDLVETATCLGLASTGGRHSPFSRTLQRLISFGMAQPASFGLAVRRKLPPLTQRQLTRLPESVRVAHHEWAQSDGPAARRELDDERGRTVAHVLLTLGDPPDQIERHLHAIGLGARTSNDAVNWALDQLHREVAGIDAGDPGRLDAA